MSLSPESLQLIAADPRWRTQRIARVDTPDGPLLIKGQRPARGPLRFKIMKWLSQLTRNPLLQPVPAHGGAHDRLVWLRHLSNQRKPWGRDIVTLQALGDFLDRWRTHLNRA